MRTLCNILVIGEVFVEKIDLLHAYVKFCSNQQRALEVLNNLELNNLAFKQVIFLLHQFGLTPC